MLWQGVSNQLVSEYLCLATASHAYVSMLHVCTHALFMLWPVTWHSIGVGYAGSPVYVAPEVLQKKYGQKADVWSAGMVAYMLLCARLPWKGDQSITTSDLYVSMGDGKSFNRKVQLNLALNGRDPCLLPTMQNPESAVSATAMLSKACACCNHDKALTCCRLAVMKWRHCFHPLAAGTISCPNTFSD